MLGFYHIHRPLECSTKIIDTWAGRPDLGHRLAASYPYALGERHLLGHFTCDEFFLDFEATTGSETQTRTDEEHSALCITSRRNFVHAAGVATCGSGPARAHKGCSCALSPP